MVAAFASALLAAAPAAAKPSKRVAITGLTVSPRTLPVTPTEVEVTLRTRNAKRCEFRGLPYRGSSWSCSKGVLRLSFNWPASNSTHVRDWTMRIIVHGVRGDVARRSVQINQNPPGDSDPSVSEPPLSVGQPCTTGPDCFPGPFGRAFPTYGNAPPSLLGSCSFAAAANWIEVMKGQRPDPTQIGFEFADAGGTATGGLNQDRLFSYWQKHGIAGTRLTGLSRFTVRPEDVRNGVRGYGALIALLNFAAGTGFGPHTIPSAGFHDVLLVGFTPTGPLVISWGEVIQMTWEQWSAEASGMWALSAT